MTQVREQTPKANEWLAFGGKVELQPGVVIPNVVKLTPKQARDSLSQKALQSTQREPESQRTSDPSKRGIVEIVRQDPAPGEIAPIGQIVTLTAIRYAEESQVPDIRGRTELVAKQILRRRGFNGRNSGARAWIKTRELSKHGKELIVEQSPSPTRSIEKGETVEYWTALHRAFVIVPDVTGMTSRDAAIQLGRSGLQYQPGKTRTNRTVKPTMDGVVVVEAQHPARRSRGPTGVKRFGQHGPLRTGCSGTPVG